MIFDDIDICINRYYKSREKLLKKLIGKRVIDALLFMPSYTIEKKRIEIISRNDVGKIVTTTVKIECIEMNYKSTTPAIVYARNGSDLIEIVLFNYQKSFARIAYPIGSLIGISGKLTMSSGGILQFINPEKFDISKIDKNSGFFNIYPLISGVTQNAIYSVIKSAFDILDKENIEEWLPEEVMIKNGFVSFMEALRNIHYPKAILKNDLANPYIRRIAFDELLAEQIVIQRSNRVSRDGYVIKNEKNYVNNLLETLPFSLTSSQITAISEIFKDLESGYPMFRLLQGDVGSGKTIVALMVALYVIESGFQVAILSPTEILAQQHYQTAIKYLGNMKVTTSLLTGSIKGKKRSEILATLQSGNLNLLVGTHAIITEAVKFKNLGLAIIDEQHRFGVLQRHQLMNKGISPHVLSMTATPIPRTMVMLLYGDVALSELTEKPANRKEIITRAFQITRIPEIIERLKNIILLGQKIYWVCPLIEDNEKLKYSCVTNRFEFLQQYFGDNVKMLHGKMTQNEKELIFDEFKYGVCNILVATSVIEVGVDVPEATCIIIENAEKFGLSQLHQLRGRVGRSNLQSFCILLYNDDISSIAFKRISLLCNCQDGFELSRQDLNLRGGGDTFGVMQSGFKQYKTFDFYSPDNQEYIFDIVRQTSHIAPKISNKELLQLVFRDFAISL